MRLPSVLSRVKSFSVSLSHLDNSYTFRYTFIMKTAISIDDELFYNAEDFSRTAGLSRSRLYCTAINEYIQNHSPDLVTEKLNSYYGNRDSKIDDDLKAAAHRLFAGEDW